MSRSNKDELEKLKRNVRNALNRTLTKVKREQSRLIVKYVAVKKGSINFFTSQKRALPSDMSIKLFTGQKQISPLMLPHKITTGGTFIKINNQKSVFVAGFGLQRNIETGGRFLISSRSNITDDFKLSSHDLRSSYKTNAGIKFTQKRKSYIVKGLPKNLAEIALDDINKLLDYAEDIFAEELER